jgi:hypothetical protein
MQRSTLVLTAGALGAAVAFGACADRDPTRLAALVRDAPDIVGALCRFSSIGPGARIATVPTSRAERHREPRTAFPRPAEA